MLVKSEYVHGQYSLPGTLTIARRFSRREISPEIVEQAIRPSHETRCHSRGNQIGVNGSVRQFLLQAGLGTTRDFNRGEALVLREEVMEVAAVLP
jgi:hypothetical protein